MDYEKKYKEVLETARELYNNPNSSSIGKAYLYTVFHELKESKDEKIRKVIRGWINTRPTSFFDNGISKEEMLTWIEKQCDTNETINKDEFAQGVLRGAAIHLITWIDYNAAEGSMCLSNTECKDITDALVNGDWDKIYAYIKKKLEKQCDKPQGKTALEAIKEEKVDNANYVSVSKAFSIGDWVVANTCTRYRAKIEAFVGNGMVEFEDGTFETEENLLNDYHLWTMQDAKDGDVLASCSSIFLFQEEYIAEKPIAYCGLMNEFFIEGKDACWTNEKCYPATKKQRDLLFQKMKEAGYMWDAENKQLLSLKAEPTTEIKRNQGKISHK